MTVCLAMVWGVGECSGGEGLEFALEGAEFGLEGSGDAAAFPFCLSDELGGGFLGVGEDAIGFGFGDVGGALGGCVGFGDDFLAVGMGFPGSEGGEVIVSDVHLDEIGVVAQPLSEVAVLRIGGSKRAVLFHFFGLGHGGGG